MTLSGSISCTAPYLPRPFWLYPTNSKELHLSRYIAKLWTVPLQMDIKSCELCGNAFTDLLTHILCSCTYINDIRNIFFENISDEGSIHLSVRILNCDDDTLVSIMLGNNAVLDLGNQFTLHRLNTKCFCFVKQVCATYMSALRGPSLDLTDG